MVFLIFFFKKVDFETKSADDKKHEKLPSMQRVTENTLIIFSPVANLIGHVAFFFN